jgi:hypothetical protein
MVTGPCQAGFAGTHLVHYYIYLGGGGRVLRYAVQSALSSPVLPYELFAISRIY